MNGRASGIILAATVVAGVAWSVQRVETHKPIASKYTYNEDIFPLLRDRCGRCHVPDGVAPMSLMTWKDAFPWAESVRAELITGHMPPWHAEAGIGRFKNAPTITSAEIDKILVWVSGSFPQGSLQNIPPPVKMVHDWPIGKPDLALQLPEAALGADRSDVVQEFTVKTGTTETKWIRAVDLLPGTSAVVRNATILLKAAAKSSEQVLAIWVPGDDPVDAENAAFQLPAGAELLVRIHYKKTYMYEGKDMTDRSTVGLYFAPGPTKAIKSLDVMSPSLRATGPKSVAFNSTVTEDLQALAFSVDPSLSNVGLQVDTVSAAGVRTPVIKLAVRPNWARRYWFEQPIALPRGTKIEVTALLDGADLLLPPAGTMLPPQPVDGSPMRVTFDVVSAGGAPTAD